MAKSKKKFDCVEMKNAAQQQLRQEYERRKAEFRSYVDFINSAANKSELVRRFRDKLPKS